MPTTTCGSSSGSTASAPRGSSIPGSRPSSSTSRASGSPRCSRSTSASTLNKKYQRADWSARPLSDEMLAYAATDTRHLPALRDELRGQLEARSRLGWVEEEFALLEGVALGARGHRRAGVPPAQGGEGAQGPGAGPAPGALRLARGDGAPARPRLVPDPEQRAALRHGAPAAPDARGAAAGEGHRARDDRAAGRGNPRSHRAGDGHPERDLPRLPRLPGGRPTRRPTRGFERLKAARNAIAARLDLAPGVACPNGTLEEIARQAPRSLADLEAIPTLRRWQREEFGRELLAAVPEPPSAPAAG